jgi:hypothetical protein
VGPPKAHGEENSRKQKALIIIVRRGDNNWNGRREGSGRRGKEFVQAKFRLDTLLLP